VFFGSLFYQEQLCLGIPCHTRYNILYNGEIGLDKGVAGIEANSKDNFWKRLPIEGCKLQMKLRQKKSKKN
jgi:hypothetical protein